MLHAGLTILFCLSMGLMFAKFRMAEDAPVDRLTRNIAAYIAAHPDEAKGHYTLARLHYMAFALRSDSILHLPGEPPTLGDPFHRGKPAERRPGRKGKIGDDEALQHLIVSTIEIETALRLDPASALAHLTSACIWEDGASFAPQVKKGDTPASWIEQAIAEYRKAHELAWLQDSKLEKQPLAGFNSLVSYEAGLSYVRMARARGLQPGEKETVETADRHIKQLSRLPMIGITPIVLSMSPHKSINDLIDPGVQTAFDLDGTGREQRWPWVHPDAALLVWDPQRTGVVTSGRQLFGTVTWWMFWENGYDALAALDDDGDGWLTGRELDGLSLWFDRNQNGRSDPGEVIPVQDLGIEAIRVKADGRDGVSWRSSQGVRLRDGSFLPTWDWVVKPVPVMQELMLTP